MKRKIIVLAAFASIFSPAAFAATDGAASDTASIGTFTNTFGTIIPGGRKVQVLMLKDASVTNTTPPLFADGVSVFPGVRDNFCVVDNAAGKVRVRFTSAVATGDWTATSIAGASFVYRMFFASSLSNPLTFIANNDTVDLFSSVTTSGDCLAGNVSKGVVATNTIGTNVSYIDTVTVTVTPI